MVLSALEGAFSDTGHSLGNHDGCDFVAYVIGEGAVQQGGHRVSVQNIGNVQDVPAPVGMVFVEPDDGGAAVSV